MPPKVAIVTGASSGIGAAVAELLAQRSYTVYGLSRRLCTIPGVHPLPADITQPDTLRAAVAQVMQEQGRLDVVIHSAGIGGAAPVEQMPVDEARRIMETNFFGAFHVAQATVPHLRRSGSAYLIMISSIAGLLGVPFHGIYSASKFALEGLVESLRLELRRTGVQVVSVCPGDTRTAIQQGQYRMDPAEALPPYRLAYAKANTAMKENVEKGQPASLVAEQIYRVLQLEQTSVRYPLGDLMQKASAYAKRLLPSRQFEKILATYYGLDKEEPEGE